MLQIHYCRMDPLAKAIGMQEDAVSMKNYMNIILRKMNNMTSLCALQEGTEEFVGVLISSIREKHDRRFPTKVHSEIINFFIYINLLLWYRISVTSIQDFIKFVKDFL